MFDSKILINNKLEQVAWWDVSHRKYCLRAIEGAKRGEYITQVNRD